jgi:hypothetical protein
MTATETATVAETLLETAPPPVFIPTATQPSEFIPDALTLNNVNLNTCTGLDATQTIVANFQELAFAIDCVNEGHLSQPYGLSH